MRGDAESKKLAAFLIAVSDLADGALMFPPPFDLATSSALAVNTDSGDLAEKLYDAAPRTCQFEVKITELAQGAGFEPVRREVVNTVVFSTRLLLALLDSVAMELQAPQQDQ